MSRKEGKTTVEETDPTTNERLSAAASAVRTKELPSKSSSAAFGGASGRSDNSVMFCRGGAEEEGGREKE